MATNGAVTRIHRRSRAKADRLVAEFERSGLGRKQLKQFSAAHGLNVHTLDAWRKRIALSGASEEMVPVELVADGAKQMATSAGSMPAASMARSVPFRIVLDAGLRIEGERGESEVDPKLETLKIGTSCRERRFGSQPVYSV